MIFAKRILRWAALGCAAVVFGAGGCDRGQASGGGGGKRPEGDRRPNIVLMTIESLRADHVHCYGYDRATTPHLDALAEAATRFAQAYSVTSWTLTSHASIFTGLYPTAHATLGPRDSLKDVYETLAEQLAKSGYQTAAVISGPYLQKKFGLSQGFQYYDETPSSKSDSEAHKDITNADMEKGINKFLDEARQSDRPFFLFLYWWDPHYDYIPPPPYDTKFVTQDAVPIKEPKFDQYFKLGKQISPDQLKYVVAKYDGELACTDEYIGRLFERLKKLGLWEETAVFATADHGEQFFEHGYLGHKFDLYTESLHVPLIARLPGDKSAKSDDRLVSLIDLYPSILEIAGCPKPAHCHGTSLFGPARKESEPIFHELKSTWYPRMRSTNFAWFEFQEWLAIRQGKESFVWRVKNNSGNRPAKVPSTGSEAEMKQLFDVAKDPMELSPITEGAAERIAALTRRLEDWRAAMQIIAAKGGAPTKAVLTPEEEQRLRSLGYLN